MKFYQETTAWESNVPNHIYLLSTDKSKMYGYIRRGTDVAETFKKPYRFDTRGRRFAEVPELGEIDLEQVKNQRWQFVGSKGDVYVVEKIDNVLQCSCPGFTFRGNCKHAKSIEETV